MLAGQYIVRVGKEYRVAFPKSFREVLGKRIILTYGFENSLLAFSHESWGKFLKEIEGKSILISKTRDIRRVFMGGAADIDFDQQGRFLIPEYLREYVKMQGEVVFVGQETYVEVWDKDKWGQRRKLVLDNITSIADELAQVSDKNE